MENVLSHCYLYEIQKRDGQILRFTNHDEVIISSGERFLPASVQAQSQIEENLGLSADNLSLSLSISHDEIAADALEKGAFEGAALKICLWDWQNSRYIQSLFAGKISSLNFSSDQAEANFQSFEEPLSFANKREFRKSCSARFGDEICQLSQADYTLRVKLVKSQNSWLGFVDPSKTQPIFAASVFENGLARIVQNAPEPDWEFAIFADRVDEGLRWVQIAQAHDLRLEKGQEIDLVMGCDLSLSCCANRFNNAQNFAGFPFIPGDDWLKLSSRHAPLNGQATPEGRGYSSQ